MNNDKKIIQQQEEMREKNRQLRFQQLVEQTRKQYPRS